MSYLVYLGTLIASVVMVFTRRIVPVSIASTERSFGSRESRNRWSMFCDIAIQVMQMRRDEFQNSIHFLRKRTDHLGLPVDKSKIRIEKVNVKASKCDLRIHGEWLIPKNGELDSSKAILYFHGGGFCLCSIDTHRHLAASVAIASKTRTFLFSYRRTPEHAYPAQINDSIEAFRYICSKEGGNYDPKNIAFVGDSAGGNLAVSLPLHLKESNESLPGAIAVMSPWADLTNSSESWFKNRSNDYLPSAHLMFEFSRFYVPDSMRYDSPKISPVFADLTGFPPMYIQVSSSEQLYDDSMRLESNAKECNVDVRMDVWKDLPHVFQAFTGKQAKQAIQTLGEWVLKKMHCLEKNPEDFDEMEEIEEIENRKNEFSSEFSMKRMSHESISVY